MKALCATVGAILLFAAGTAQGVSNIDPDHSEAWGANVGWLNWRPDAQSGVEAGQYIFSGNVYSANLGWVSLGNGAPANGIQYSNSSATDWGINVEDGGHLRGFAYGANIGWINFETQGAPRLDLATGHLSGFAYGANVGWINLGDQSFSLAATSISAGKDTDGDGIPDAWEYAYAGDLATFSATSDSDHDGQTDLEEYLAGTNPKDPNDALRFVTQSLSADGASFSVTWTTQISRQYLLELRPDFGPEDSWQPTTSGPQIPSGPVMSATVPAAAVHGFFRVRVLGALTP